MQMIRNRTPELPTRDYWSVKEFADAAGVTRAWVYELIAQGVLRPTQFRRRRTTAYRFQKEYAVGLIKRIRSGVPLSLAQTDGQ